MAIKAYTGNPFVGYLSLTAAATPTNIPIFSPMGSAAYTLKATEKLMVTNITVSSNDTSPGLFTITSGGTTPTKLMSAYVSGIQVIQPESISPGILVGILGTLLIANVTTLTGAKTIEIVIKGAIVST